MDNKITTKLLSFLIISFLTEKVNIRAQIPSGGPCSAQGPWVEYSSPQKNYQSDNKKPEEFESEFDHFDLDYSYPTSPHKGCNMDLDFVYKQLLDGHKACKTTLSLT